MSITQPNHPLGPHSSSEWAAPMPLKRHKAAIGRREATIKSGAYIPQSGKWRRQAALAKPLFHQSAPNMHPSYGQRQASE